MSYNWNSHNEFMAAWANEDANTDNDILAMIEEHTLFKKCADFEFEEAVNQVFNNLDFMAEQVEEEQIAAAGASIAADACALAAVFSFGMSMGPFLVLEGSALAFTAIAASEQARLTTAMQSADADIADKIGSDSDVATWIKLYKVNNKLNSNLTRLFDDKPHKEARKIIFECMAGIEARGEELTLDSFRYHAEWCKLLWKNPHKDIVTNAYNKLESSSRSSQDVEDCLKALQNYGFTFLERATQPTFFSMTIYFLTKDFNVTEDAIRICVDKGMLPESVLYDSILEAGKLVGRGSTRVLAGISGIFSVLDMFFEVYEIVEAVKQANKIKASISHMRKGYHDYFKNIKDGALEYNNTVVLFHKKGSIGFNIMDGDGTHTEFSLENVKPSDTVNDIKLKLIKDHGCPPRYSWIWLTHNRDHMNEEHRTLYSYGMKTRGNFTINLYYQGISPSI